MVKVLGSIEGPISGGASNLTNRVGVIANFASPNAGGIVSGFYYDNAFQGTSASTLAGAADRMDLAPFFTSMPLAIDTIGTPCSTAVASSNIKIVVYSTGSNGWPGALIKETAALSTASTGYKSEAWSYTFQSGTMYWLGVRHSSTATLRTINVGSAVNLGLGSSSTSTTYNTVIRRTLAFATAAPSTWTFNSAELTGNITPPSIRMRAA